MRLFLLLGLVLVLAAGCDSSTRVGPEDDPSAPTGRFEVDPVWFRLSMRIAAGQVEDLQAWIDGTLTLEQDGQTLTGSGTCTLRRRRHKAWLGETSDVSETRPFSLAGTLNGSQATLTLQGCAWAMAEYRGTFSDGTYTLRLRNSQAAPVWEPSIWAAATQLDGDDPFELVLRRP